MISKNTHYVSTDGWRGYYEPDDAVGGANDTGMWEDSPCPSGVRKKEIADFCAKLRRAGIKYRTMWCRTANVFCQHQYVVVDPVDHEKAYKIAEAHKQETTLFYPVEKWKKEKLFEPA